ncbi:MAG: phosphoribosyltransferase family protein [Acidimicrobiia bacterium]
MLFRGHREGSWRAPLFENRVEAGRRLAERLGQFHGNCVVVGLPRGGVPVAAEVAAALDVPLDVIVVRKLGVPSQPELGMGAIGEGGVRVVNEDIVHEAAVRPEELDAVERRERVELERRLERFRAGRPAVSLAGRTVVIVDDGIATGSTAKAACRVARALGAARVVLAVPLAPPHWIEDLGDAADELLCLATPEPFRAIGPWYRDFTQTSDDDVVAALASAARRVRESAPSAAPATHEAIDREVAIGDGSLRLAGRLTVPSGATSVVVFAHGSGSSRHSPRNRFVADTLNGAGIGTLLMDLLTVDEEHDRSNVFDIELLARRLVVASTWLRDSGVPAAASIGYFGASTGAGAALVAAASGGADVRAIVSRGGRPDLAGAHLAHVQAPTLLIVGGADIDVLRLNQYALAQLRCEKKLEIVPGATHLFEERGALEAVAALARDWFVDHLG